MSTILNTITIQVVSVSKNWVKYFMFADLLNEVTKPHTYFFNTGDDTIEQIDYTKLRIGELYVIECSKHTDTWIWYKAHNINRCIR